MLNQSHVYVFALEHNIRHIPLRTILGNAQSLLEKINKVILGVIDI